MDDTAAGTGGDHYRLFVAICLPPEVQNALEAVQTELRLAAPEGQVHWTQREQFHLTLRFLGNVEAQRANVLAEVVRGVCRGFSPLRLRAAQIGFFPELRRPRVVWAGVRDQSRQLPLLHRALQEATAPFTSEPPENRLSGHITLGRIKSMRRPEAERLAKVATGLAERVFGEWMAGEVEIIRSELSAAGPKYTCLGAFPTCGGGKHADG